MFDDYPNEADQQMAALQAAGNAAARGRRRMLTLRAAGQLAEAACACHHSAGYATNGEAANYAKDPRAGLRGMRCSDCGSWWKHARHLFDMRDRAPDAPCELAPR